MCAPQVLYKSEMAMHPYQTNYATNQFWTDVKTRLAPVLGDVETSLGQYWMDRFEDCFNRSDFLALEIAKQTNGHGFNWFLIELHQAAERLIEDDSICAANSQMQAIAHLAARCSEVGVWPSEAIYVNQTNVIELKLGNQPFALIKPLPRSITNNEATLVRSKSTLHGLRKSSNCAQELTKRTKSWPGLSTIVYKSSFLPDKTFHFATPSEWLISARKLAATAGLGEISTSQAQQLAATAMGEPTWNHLCGHFQENVPGPTLSCPWYVSSGGLGLASESYTPYSDFYDGFAVFLARAQDLVSGQDGWQICPGTTLYRTPYFTLEHPPESPPPGQLASPSWFDLTKLNFMPIKPVLTNDVWEPRTIAALRCGITEGLNELLQIGRNNGERQTFRNAELGRTVIAQDAGWLFSIEGEGESRYFYAELIDQNGNQTSGTAATATYKGEFNWSEKLGAHVLSSEYDGRRPIAIIKGISETTRDRILVYLRSAPTHRAALKQPEKTDQLRLAELIERMGPNGATQEY